MSYYDAKDSQNRSLALHDTPKHKFQCIVGTEIMLAFRCETFDSEAKC